MIGIVFLIVNAPADAAWAVLGYLNGAVTACALVWLLHQSQRVATTESPDPLMLSMLRESDIGTRLELIVPVCLRYSSTVLGGSNRRIVPEGP